MKPRILFLCARASPRSLMAASILAEKAANQWEIWSTPTQGEHGLHLAELVLRERGIPLITADHIMQPTFDMRWDEGIVLCSGETDI
jgi:protein-tyrosine-phosphatase